MAQDRETKIVTSRTISCDGGGGALGHPRTFYTIGESGEVVCGYCGQRFRLDPNAPADTGH
ncbi:MAG: zinc-finger domain-containing protein [Geminicoccus sp.]|nr:zinc-finger domain-containing protein [Geminicoccus sp.]